jgi:glycosyltransferase involved in cell wall biosynthesis
MGERRFETAVLIPCLNEAGGIADVVEGFRKVLPEAAIYVYDNASVDETASVAARAGATVRREASRGKGNVVRRMFADVEADVYVMVDGDGTYDCTSAPAMIQLLTEQQLDMVCARRVETDSRAYRQGHRLGNLLLTGLVKTLFGGSVTDILSGYRVMSRRFVKSFPALSKGFETETELTVHALDLRAPIAEVTTPYGARSAGSASKLNTWRDGWRILRTIARLVKEERPFGFFATIGGVGGGP